MEAFPEASVGPWLDSGILKSFAFCHFVFISGSKRPFSLAVFCKHSLCKFKLLPCPDGGPSVNMQEYCWPAFPENNKDCFPRKVLLEVSLLGCKHRSHNTHVCGRDPTSASWSPSFSFRGLLWSPCPLAGNNQLWKVLPQGWVRGLPQGTRSPGDPVRTEVRGAGL